MIKKIFTLFLLLLFVTGCTNKLQQSNLYDKIVERDKLVVGVKTDSKPFGYIESNSLELTGVDVDIAKRLAKDILGDETKLTLIPLTPDNRIEAVTSGKVDLAIATMSITPEREQVIDFSIPYHISGQTVLVKATSDITTYSDLNQKRVATVVGTTATANVKNNIPNALMTTYKSYDEAFLALQHNRIDALSTDDTILSAYAANYYNYKILSPRLTIEPYGIAIRKGDDTVSLKSAVNRSLQQMKTDGSLNEIKHKYGLV